MLRLILNISLLNEETLIHQLKAGDEQAFRQLVESYQHLVYNTVLGIVQDVQEAEDVAQEVFIQVYRSISGFRGEAQLSTWLYRIAITKLQNNCGHPAKS